MPETFYAIGQERGLYNFCQPSLDPDKLKDMVRCQQAGLSHYLGALDGPQQDRLIEFLRASDVSKPLDTETLDKKLAEMG